MCPSDGLWGASLSGLLGVVGGVLRQRWLPKAIGCDPVGDSILM